MYKLNQKMIDFYQSNPEALKLRCKVIEFMFGVYAHDLNKKPTTEQITRSVSVFKSYWIVPEEKDYKKML